MPMQLSDLDQLTDQPVSHNPKVRKKVWLNQHALPHLTQFAEARFPPGESAAAHRHEDLYEVFLVQSGSGRMQVEQQEIELHPGLCVTVEPGETHEIVNTGTEPLIVRYFAIRNAPDGGAAAP